eukprot:Gb_36703 [translate_table: standard]
MHKEFYVLKGLALTKRGSQGESTLFVLATKSLIPTEMEGSLIPTEEKEETHSDESKKERRHKTTVQLCDGSIVSSGYGTEATLKEKGRRREQLGQKGRESDSENNEEVNQVFPETQNGREIAGQEPTSHHTPTAVPFCPSHLNSYTSRKSRSWPINGFATRLFFSTSTVVPPISDNNHFTTS